MLTLNVKELQPEFPPLHTSSTLPYFNTLNSSHNSSFGENIKLGTPTLISSSTTTNAKDTKNDKNRFTNTNFVPMQYRYMLRRMQKERPIQLEG